MTPEDDYTLRTIRRRFGAFERFCLGTAAVLGTLFVAASVQGARREAEMGQQLVARRAELGDGLDARHTTILHREAAATRELATTEAPDVASPSALPSLQGGGVYLRVISSRATEESDVLRASRESSKDAFASCLSLGVRDTERETSACAPESGCVGDATSKLVNLRILLAGLAPFHDGWSARAKDASGIELTVLASELDVAASGALTRARKAVDEASFVLLAVDDVPKGTRMDWGETGLATVQTLPHDVKIAVLDARTFEPLFRAKLRADAVPSASPGANSSVLRQVQGCSLGLAVAERLRGG